MTYRQFLGIIDYSDKRVRRILAIYGGSCVVRMDVLKIYFDGIQKEDGKLLPRWITLSEVVKNPASLSQESVHTVLVVYWESGLLDKEKTKKFLRLLGKLKCRVAILDASEEISSVFQSIYPKGSAGFWVDCSKESPRVGSAKGNPAPMTAFIKVRLGKFGIYPNAESLRYLTEVSLESLINVFSMLEAIGEQKVDVSLLQELDLLRLNIERGMVKVLFEKGKSALMRFKLPVYDEGRFLRYTIEELVLLLRTKTVGGSSPTKRAANLGMQLYPYKKMVELTDRFELKKLFERLYLCLLLWKWRNFRGVSLMLLSLW